MTANTKKTSEKLRGDMSLDRISRKKIDPAILQRGVLAIDPGSHRTGWAWWKQMEDPRPAMVGVIEAPNGSLAQRATKVRDSLQEIYDACDCPLGSVAIERPIPLHRKPAVELEAVFSEINTWSRSLSRKRGPSPDLVVRTYNNQTVKATVCPRHGEWAKEGTAKEKLMAGVVGHLGTYYRFCPEDAIDAIAVGLMHLMVIRQEVLVDLLVQDMINDDLS